MPGSLSSPRATGCDQETLQAVMDNIFEGVVVIDEQGTIELFNPAAERLFGYSAGEVVGKNVRMLIPELYRSFNDICTSGYRETECSKVIGLAREVLGLRKDGSTFSIHLAITEVRGGGGPKFVGILRDVSEEKKAHAALVESEERFRRTVIFQRAILDGANFSIISTTSDGVIAFLNATAERWLGYRSDEVVKKFTLDVFHDPVEIAQYAAELSEELGQPMALGFEVLAAKARRGIPDEREWSYLRKDGSRFPVLLFITPLYDANESIMGFLSIACDIADRRRAEEAVARLASLVESSDDAITGGSLDGTIQSWNEGARKLYGYSASEILGRNISVLVPPGRLDEIHEILNRIRRGERVARFETIRIAKGGRIIDVSLTVSPIMDSAGRIVGVSTIGRDITKRKRIEEQLRKLSTAVEQSPVAVVITDPLGNIEYVNPKFTSITGYSPEEVLGKNPRILKSGEKSPEEYRILWDTITSGREWRGEFHNRKKNGELYWESASISPIKDARGNITHFVAVKEDITSLKEFREELARLSLVASRTDNAVIITDRDGIIEWVNEGFVHLTGYTLPEVAGKKPGQVLQGPLSDRATINRMREFLRARKAFREEILNYHKDGHTYWVSIDATPIFNDAGELVRFISIESDITDRKRSQEALQQAKEAADAANRAKTEFLAAMSHEIRTPMNAIIGMAELLWKSPLSPEQRKYVQVFRSAGETLLDLINDILDLSKVEASHIKLETIAFDLTELMEMTCEVMATGAHEKGLELVCRIFPDIPRRLVGDPGRLRQVLTNLIGNALKFTEKGEIVVEVRSSDVEGGDGPQSMGRKPVLLFSIRDTGIGIEPDKIDVIFEKFRQADTSITRKYGGTGLGLTISKRLVELMGGELRVESRLGEGTTFSFSVQFDTEPSLMAGEPAPGMDLSGIKILIVDDNAVNRWMLREILRQWGAEVTEAENGEDCLAELNRSMGTGAPYRLVLLDQRMPGMDGFQVAECIKKTPGLDGIVLMMLTSDTRDGDTARIQDLAPAGCLVKPIKEAELLAAIQRAMGREFASRIEEKSACTDDDLKTLNILLVEDSATNRFLIEAYLKNTGCRIESAENGQIAVEKYMSGGYDLVLMDMQMPVMDGYTATRAIRDWERDNGLPHVPVVALTAYALKEDAQKSLDAGCDAHLSKPVKRSELMEVLKVHAR